MAYASRHSYYLVGSVAAFLQVFAYWWGVYSHLLFENMDHWWNPPLITLYACVAITILTVWKGLRVTRPHPPLPVSPIRFVNLAGLRMTGLGCLIEVGAGVWSETVHYVPPAEVGISPAYALLSIGMLTVSLGIVVGLTIEYGMIKRGLIVVTTVKRWVTALCVLVSFSAIWLAASGSFIYLGQVQGSFLLNWAAAVLLGLVGTLVLVCAKRVMPKLGSVIAIGCVFNAVTYFFLIFYGLVAPYIPWGLLPLSLFDLLASGLGRMFRFTRVLVLCSLVLGVFCWVVYFPFTRFLFPWLFSLQFSTVAVILGSVAGGWIGIRVYAGLSSVVLHDAATV